MKIDLRKCRRGQSLRLACGSVESYLGPDGPPAWPHVIMDEYGADHYCNDAGVSGPIGIEALTVVEVIR